MAENMEQRQAPDGQWYTYKEFSDYYGHAGPRKWDDAQLLFDDAGNTGRQHEAGLEHSNVTPLAEESQRSWDTYGDDSQRPTWHGTAQHGEHTGRQREAGLERGNVTPLAEESRGRSQEAKQCWASQLAPVSESSVVQPHAEVVGIASSSTNLPPAGDDGPPLAALPNGTTADTARTPTLPDLTLEQVPVLTITQLNNTRRKTGFGGKEANRKQRSLREQLLPQRRYEYDLTEDDWDWRQVLKALPPNVQESVVGAGITKFRFRLLQDVMDHNYRKIDSGERHVFHVDRVDGSAVHLHFHKNGKMDAPEVFKNEAVSGAVPPAAGTGEPESTVKLIGKNEAHMAFLNLLGDGAATGSVDVTDTVGFAWPRFLQNQVQRHEMLGPGITKVLVVRFVRNGNPSLVICRTDGTYVVITPAERSKCMLTHAAWSEQPLFMRAATASVPWMQITK